MNLPVLSKIRECLSAALNGEALTRAMLGRTRGPIVLGCLLPNCYAECNVLSPIAAAAEPVCLVLPSALGDLARTRLQEFRAVQK